MQKKATTQRSNLPASLCTLPVRDLFVLTGIPVSLLEGFIAGKFKPCSADRKKLSNAAVPFYAFSDLEAAQFILRKKYRAIKRFLTQKEKADFLYSDADYGKKVNEYLVKYWPRIEQAMAMTRAERKL